MILIIEALAIILLLIYVALGLIFVYITLSLASGKKKMIVKKEKVHADLETTEIHTKTTSSPKGGRVVSPMKQKKEKELMEEITS